MPKRRAKRDEEKRDDAAAAAAAAAAGGSWSADAVEGQHLSWKAVGAGALASVGVAMLLCGWCSSVRG